MNAKPIIKALPPQDGSSLLPDPQTQAEMNDINYPASTQLALHYKRVEIRYEQLLTARENDYEELRELTRFKKDNFNTICNSVFSTFLVTIGTYILSADTIPFFDLQDRYEVKGIGWVIVFTGVVSGVLKPAAGALLWRLLGHKGPGMKCLHCGKAAFKK